MRTILFIILTLMLTAQVSAQPYLYQDGTPNVIRWQVLGFPPEVMQLEAIKGGGLKLDMRGIPDGTYYVKTRYLMDDGVTWSIWSDTVQIKLPLQLPDDWYPKAHKPKVQQ